MARSNSMENYLCLRLLLLLLQAIICLQLALSHSTVNYLPGFNGSLPFHLETGYIGVGESEDVQLFYYFVKSQGNVKEDPLMLWLTGGPGCSAWSGLVFEIGPLNFKVEEYNGTLPTLVLNPHSWTQVASIIFVDMPVGTGFSYARTALASRSNDTTEAARADEFLRKWIIDHPEFLSHPVYIGGDSYSGYTVPAILEQISNGNEKGIKPFINVKGYLLGNPGTDRKFDDNSQIPFAHGMGLISDELYESLKKSCMGEYRIIDPSNTECLKHMQEFNKCTSRLNHAHILERSCVFASPKPTQIFGKRRYLHENIQQFLDPEPSLPSFGCRTYGYLLSAYWANDKNVRKALNVREGSIGKWVRCNHDLPYTKNIHSSIKYHMSLSVKGHRSLIYRSGDQDMLIPFVGTQAWIRSLNFSIVEDWRPWYLHDQVAGYTRTYSNQMTFTTVKGAGHTAPEYKPAACLGMFQRWINQESL